MHAGPVIIYYNTVLYPGTWYIWYPVLYILVWYGTVCLGKTKTLGVLKGLSTDHFGIIKRAIHVMCDISKSAFEWEPKENLEE